MGGGGDVRQKKTLLSFPVPLPISFLTSSALPQSPLWAPSFPNLVSHTAGERASPASLPKPLSDTPPAKRQRVDEAAEGVSPIGVWRAAPLCEAAHAKLNELPRGEITCKPSSPLPSTSTTRLEQKSGVGDINVAMGDEEPSLVPAQRHEVSPSQRQQHILRSPEQQLPQGARGKRQFGVAAELLQSIPIWRRHPESISALLKAASEAVATRQRRQAAGEQLKAERMLDGGPFTSATIHWEVRRQAVCVKAHTPAGRCACRYFPVNRLSPFRRDVSLRTSAGSSTGGQKRGPLIAGEKPHIVCPKRLLFAAYVFFLQLPLLRPGSSQRAPRDLHLGPPLSLPADPFTAGRCREINAEIQGGFRGLSKGLYCGTTTETASRQRGAAAARRDSLHADGEGGGFRIAAEALAAAAVAVGCLSASAPLTEQRQHHQQAARLRATVVLLRWSCQSVDADSPSRCGSASIGRLEQLRLLPAQQQGEQQQREQSQQHDGQSFVNGRPNSRHSADGEIEAEGEARVASTSGNSCSSVACPEAALTCKLCGHRTGASAAGVMSAFEGHWVHLLESHAFLAPLVGLILSICPSEGPVAAVAAHCAAAFAGFGRNKSNRGDIARALRQLSSDKGIPCRCLHCHHQQQHQQEQQKQEMAPVGDRSPYAYLSRAAFAAAATVATETVLQEVEGLVTVNSGLSAAERRRLLLCISSEAAYPKWPFSIAEGKPVDPGSPTLPLTHHHQQESHEQELSPPSTAVRGETTLPRLLQEQETRQLELQLLRPASGAYGPRLLSLALQGPERGAVAVCAPAAPTQQAAAFLTQHLRPAVNSLMLLPSVRKTIAAATWPETSGSSSGSAAAAARDTPRSCSGSLRATCRQPQRAWVASLRRILSEERADWSGSCSHSKSRCTQNGFFSVTASMACSKRHRNASKSLRRSSWYEALSLTPQCSSILPVESCAAASVAAAGSETIAARGALGLAAKTLHLLALLVPPVGGSWLQQDRLEILSLEREASPSHPYVSSLMQGDPQAVPQSIGSLYLALPETSGIFALKLRQYIAACGRPLILELLISRPVSPILAPTSDAESASIVRTRFALAAASAANSFRRQLKIVEDAAEALCHSNDEVASVPEVLPFRPLLQYVSARMHCSQCGYSCSHEHLCSNCAAALDNAAAATKAAEAGMLSTSADLDKRVFSFLSEILLLFLKTWGGEKDGGLFSAPGIDDRIGRSPLDTCQTSTTAAEADEDCAGLLADVLTTHASVQRECLSFGGLPRACDDSQTGKAVLLHAVASSCSLLLRLLRQQDSMSFFPCLVPSYHSTCLRGFLRLSSSGLWVQAAPFVAHVVRGVPLMARHQLQRLAAPVDTPNLAADSKGPAAAPVGAASLGVSSSRRCASSGVSTIAGADSNSPSLPQQPFVNCPSAAVEAPLSGASLPAGAIEGTRGTSPLASSFYSLRSASEPVGAGPRIHFESPEEEDPVPWKSIDLFAWSLLDENGASPELSLQLRRSKALSRKRTSTRASLGGSPASRTSETTGACTDEAPSPAAALIAATAAAAGSTGEAWSALQPRDFTGPPLHGDSSTRVLAAVWQAASCRTLDLAAAEAQCRRVSPFFGLLIEECGCIPEAADLQLRRNELASVCEAMERSKTAQVYETTCKAAQLAARQKHLRVAKSAVHGWGVFAAEPIRRGEFIVEYAGNAVAEAKANFLEEQYVQSMGGSTYFFKLKDGSIVDATSCGAATRFINHSCAPNCCTVDILDEDDEAGGSHVGLLALRDIEAGEELSYNYR
ncbi:hypothetical protein ACSSS7_003980 [Eimeria intestinalis]